MLEKQLPTEGESEAVRASEWCSGDISAWCLLLIGQKRQEASELHNMKPR